MSENTQDPRARILASIAAASAPVAPDVPAPEPARAAPRTPASDKEDPKTSQTGASGTRGSEKGGGGGKGDGETPEGETSGAETWDLDCARLPLTDLGNAQRFVLRHGDAFLYCAEWGWLAWDGRRWSRERADGLFARAVHATVLAIRKEAMAFAESGDDWMFDDKKKLFWSDKIYGWGLTSQGASHINCIERLVRCDLEASVDDFDADAWTFNVLNGTLRFKVDPDGGDTVRFSKHDRADRITKLAPVAFDRDAECPGYDAFLAQMQPDPQMRRHLHCWGGVSITGDVSIHKMAFWYGKGRNGKSTLLSAWHHVGGDYGAMIPVESFLDQGRQRQGGAPTPDLAALAGKRMLMTSEPERGAKLAEGLIKTATGEERLRVRELNLPYFDLRIQFTLTMFGNYKPRIDGTDDGIWSRLVLVPWLKRVGKADIDRELPARLKTEGSGILNRLLDGVRDFLDNGLVLPQEVEDATSDFRAESDPLGRFLEVCTEYEDGARVQSTELYRVFVAWCRANGEREWKIQGFGRALGERGYRSRKSDVSWWFDIKLTRHVWDFIENWEAEPRFWKPKERPPAGVEDG